MLIHSHRREHVLKGLDGWMDGICAHMNTHGNKAKKQRAVKTSVAAHFEKKKKKSLAPHMS